jgi:hypothetical protein
MIVMYLVEWVFVSAVMAVVGGIMFPMSGWRADKIGNYIGYMVAEAFASTGLNLVCAYVAASIPYANACFTLHYFYGEFGLRLHRRGGYLRNAAFTLRDCF